MNYKRNTAGNKIYDPASVGNSIYNDKAGAQKNMEVGRKLIPIQLGGSYTTDCTTKRSLPMAGRNLAVYNKGVALAAVTVGDSTVTAQASGVSDANGQVGIPCAPAQWTFIACGESICVIAENANLLVFLIDDESYLTPDNAR